MKRRYDIAIRRLDNKNPKVDPGRHIEFLDLETRDQSNALYCTETERRLKTHFVALACAAHREEIRVRFRDMPWLAEYTLAIYEPGGKDPIAHYREA